MQLFTKGLCTSACDTIIYYVYASKNALWNDKNCAAHRMQWVCCWWPQKRVGSFTLSNDWFVDWVGLPSMMRAACTPIKLQRGCGCCCCGCYCIVGFAAWELQRARAMFTQTLIVHMLEQHCRNHGRYNVWPLCGAVLPEQRGVCAFFRDKRHLTADHID